MKRLYWLLMSLINNDYSLEYTKYGEGEYLAKHGVPNGVDDAPTVIEGEELVKLDKHLQQL